MLVVSANWCVGFLHRPFLEEKWVASPSRVQMLAGTFLDVILVTYPCSRVFVPDRSFTVYLGSWTIYRNYTWNGVVQAVDLDTG
jgi:hypothetical protein